MEEAINIAYDDDNVQDIYIEPPEQGFVTDEDSGEEDAGGLIDNLSGSQLRSQAELKIITTTAGNEDEMLEERETEITPTVASPSVWVDGDLVQNGRAFVSGDYSKYRNQSCVELFEMYLDNETIDYLIKETTRYALFKNCADPAITKNELKCFLGILILSGYNQVPSKRHYWENNGDMKNELVRNSMRRNRFLEIMRFIHCADNTTPQVQDKVWKLRPLMDLVKNKCLKYFEPEECLNYDESMVKYFGRHSCKQFIRGKPIRFGYKMWCLNTPDGYLVNFDMYQGNNPRRHMEYERCFGKSSAPFLQMLDELPIEKKQYPYKLYFENLFTGFAMLKHLKERGYDGTGTIRENRIPKSCPLPKKNIIKKNKTWHL